MSHTSHMLNMSHILHVSCLNVTYVCIIIHVTYATYVKYIIIHLWHANFIHEINDRNVIGVTNVTYITSVTVLTLVFCLSSAMLFSAFDCLLFSLVIVQDSLIQSSVPQGLQSWKLFYLSLEYSSVFSVGFGFLVTYSCSSSMPWK